MNPDILFSRTHTLKSLCDIACPYPRSRQWQKLSLSLGFPECQVSALFIHLLSISPVVGEVFPILQLGLCSPSDVVVKSLCWGLRQTRVSAASQRCVIEEITHILQVLVSSHVSRNNNNSICFLELM